MGSTCTSWTTLVAVLMAHTLATSAAVFPTKTLELGTAIGEMVTANYFTFVMLINMSPLDLKLQGNLTFLMPNDRMLSKIRIPQTAVSDFLLRHSIPSPLLFDYLQHIPSGSMLPSSAPGYMLTVHNHGRRNFSLNNARIISPNICTAGSSIRCHGIDGVLEAAQGGPPPLPTCSDSTTPASVAASPPESPSLPPPSIPGDDTALIPVAAPNEETKPGKSGSSHPPSHGQLMKFLAESLVVTVVGFLM